MWLWSGLAWWSAAGFLLITAMGLVALHLLRPRPRRVRVMTTVFWEEAAATVHGSAIGGLLSQWLSLLLLMVALLLSAMALTGPIWTSSETSPLVVVIDNGFPSEAVGDFNRAVERHMPSAQSSVAVVAASPSPRILQAPGQTDGRGMRRLGLLRSDVTASTGPSLQLADTLTRLFGDQARILVLTPSAQRWRDAASALKLSDRVTVTPLGETQNNVGILGATWRGDRPLSSQGVLVLQLGVWQDQSAEIRLDITDNTSGSRLVEQAFMPPADVTEFSHEVVVPARGQDLTISIHADDDAAASDNNMVFTLPARPLVSARPGPDVPASLLIALQASGSLVEPVDPDRPSRQIELWVGANDQAVHAADILVDVSADSGDQQQGLALVRGTAWAHGIDFRDAWLPADPGEAPLGSEDRVVVSVHEIPLAWITHAPEQAPRFVLRDVWFSEGSTAVSSGGFVVMVSRAVAQLLDLDQEPASLTAERALDDAPWWEQQASADEQIWSIAPGSREASDLMSSRDQSESQSSSGWDLHGRGLLAFLSLGVIGVSWWLYERGRIA